MSDLNDAAKTPEKEAKGGTQTQPKPQVEGADVESSNPQK